MRRLDTADIIHRAKEAVRKIDEGGRDAVEELTPQEIEACVIVSAFTLLRR